MSTTEIMYFKLIIVLIRIILKWKYLAEISILDIIDSAATLLPVDIQRVQIAEVIIVFKTHMEVFHRSVSHFLSSEELIYM